MWADEWPAVRDRDRDWDSDSHWIVIMGGGCRKGLLTSTATFCGHDTADCRGRMSARILSACGQRRAGRVGRCWTSGTCGWLRPRLRRCHRPLRRCPPAGDGRGRGGRSSSCGRHWQWDDRPPGTPVRINRCNGIRSLAATVVEHYHIDFDIRLQPTLQLSS